jgi:hypothetical protein
MLKSPFMSIPERPADNAGRRPLIIAISLLVCLTCVGTILNGCGGQEIPATESPEAWTVVAPGMEFRTFAVTERESVDDSQITILRIDPELWELVLIGKSWAGVSDNRTAKDWCEEYGLTSAINAGMFDVDGTTHVGHLSSKGHTNSRPVNKYMSVAAFDPKREEFPEFRLFDLDVPDVTMDTIRRDFSSVVQNLRFIKKPCENRWSQQKEKWSEAALGEDSSGRVLFIFTRSPFSMHDLNLSLLSLGIGLVAAQHLEGGPEAQLYLQAGSVTQELMGSYETSFQENDENAELWPIPNIIGVRPRLYGDDKALVRAQVDKTVGAQNPLVVHVIVALCDNKYQGIVPVPAELGNGRDPGNNLYWGAMYGVRSYLTGPAGWKLVSEPSSSSDDVLEKIVLHTTVSCSGSRRSVYLVAEAWEGRKIKGATERFLQLTAGRHSETVKVDTDQGTVSIKAGGDAHLVAYVGHNGLMDFSVQKITASSNTRPRSAIVLACRSRDFFKAKLRATRARSLLLTTGLMAPEAYTLNAAIRSWAAGDNSDRVIEHAASAYHKYQKCGLSAARRLFVSEE